MNFRRLDDAVAEGRRLLANGYTRLGKWSLGQVCRHLRITVDANLDGYPKWMGYFAFLRPILRRLLLPKLLRGDAPAGIRTAKSFQPPADLDDEEELAAFAQSVARFQAHDGYLHPHPGFGYFEHAELEAFHAAHAAHHFGFLVPMESEA